MAADDVFHTHANPIWRDRANFLIRAAMPEHHHFEQLWARKESEDLFEICCIPFFAYDVSLGDIVRTEPAGYSRYLLTEVVRPSGRRTFRIWLGGSGEDPLAVESELADLGVLTEWSSPQQLLAVDVEGEPMARMLEDRLAEGERRRRWMYEAGRL